MKTQGHIQQQQGKKEKFEFRLVNSTYVSYSFDQAPSDFYLFLSQQNVLNDKKCFQKDQKTFLGIFLSFTLKEFYLRGIDNRPDKWLEVIQNSDEYTIVTAN